MRVSDEAEENDRGGWRHIGIHERKDHEEQFCDKTLRRAVQTEGRIGHQGETENATVKWRTPQSKGNDFVQGMESNRPGERGPIKLYLELADGWE